MKVWNKASIGVGKAAEWDKEYIRMKMTKKQMRVDIIRAGEYQEEVNQARGGGGGDGSGKVSHPALDMLAPALNF